MLRLLLLGAIISTNVFLYVITPKFHISQPKSTIITVYPLIFIVSFGNMVQIWIPNFYFLL